MWYFLNLYLQQVLGYGAFASGAALLPMTVLIMVLMVGVAPRLIARFGPKPLIVGGLVALAAACCGCPSPAPSGNFAVDVLPASLVAALGQALAFIPSLGPPCPPLARKRADWPQASSTPPTRSARRSAWPR